MKKTNLTLLFILLSITVFSQSLYVNIPDSFFKNALINNHSINTRRVSTLDQQNIDTNEAKAFNGIIDLSLIPTTAITSLSGIEKFVNITGLKINQFNIDSIDLSNNTNVRYVHLTQGSGFFQYLNISNCSLLTYLNISNCDFTSLDVSNNPLLDSLDITSNSITSIDLSNNSKLKYFQAGGNDLRQLNLENNINLEVINVVANRLNNLDLSKNSKLTAVGVFGADLVGLNLANGNDTLIDMLNTRFSPNLSCIQVDDSTYSHQNWRLGSSRNFFFDSHHYFSTSCPFVPCEAKFYKTQPTLGQVTIIDSTAGSNLKYKWYFGDGDSSSAYKPRHTYNSAGSYYVCLQIEDTIGLCKSSFCDTITVDSSGLLRNGWSLKVIRNYVSLETPNDFQNIKIFPNPTNGLFKVELDQKTDIKSAYIFDINGRIIKSISPQYTDNFQVDINASRGLYFLIITNEFSSKKLRFVIN